MDIANNMGMWGIFATGVMLGAGLVFVTIVPKALALGRREGYAEGTAKGQATGEPAPTPHTPVRLSGGPADGLYVEAPAPLCSRVGLRLDISLVDDDTHLVRHFTYTIVRPHEAEHTPEEGDDA